MLNLITKLSGIFAPQNSKVTPPQPVARETNEITAKNRVGFSANKPTNAPIAPSPVVQMTKGEADQVATKAAIASATKELEQAYQIRTQALAQREKYLEEKEKDLDNQLKSTKNRQEQLEDLHKKQLEKLETIAGLDVEKAKQLVIAATERKMAPWIAKKIEEARESIKTQTEEFTKEYVVDALRHGFTSYVAEYTISTMTLPNDEVKGKIIGREGKNIRTFEKAAGVEIEMDDGNELRISSFDSTRREVARLALEKLIKDGRIQPVKIEEVVRQTREEMDKILLNEGKKICAEVGVYNLPADLMKIIGRYKFRYSYGQNLAKHTIEATKIAVGLAAELKADINTVRLGTLLHDIGKVINDKEGTHIELGVELLRQYHMPEAVIAAVAEHHEDQPFSSKESVIVYLGDAASGSRPGARYEAGVEHIKRMENIEKVAQTFSGVSSVAAYQAGREVMVIVDPGVVSEAEMQVLSQKIANQLEEEAKWAGSIKVTVLRESRASATIIGKKVDKNAGNDAN